MKPNRLLPKPDQPHFTVIRKNDATEKVPEWRLGQLLRTKCFQNFLRNHTDWLTSEGQQNLTDRDVIGRDDICPERIEEIPASVREESEFKHKWDEAVNDQSGEAAFKFYEEYKQRKIQIEGESVAKKFLSLAKERKCKAAETEWLKISGIVGNERKELEQALKDGGVTNIDHVLVFLARVKKLKNKINLSDVRYRWCFGSQNGRENLIKGFRERFNRPEGKLMGVPTSEKTPFSSALRQYFCGVQPPEGNVWAYEGSNKIWESFKNADASNLTDGEIAWLTVFFMVVAEDDASIDEACKTIGKVLWTKEKSRDGERWFADDGNK